MVYSKKTQVADPGLDSGSLTHLHYPVIRGKHIQKCPIHKGNIQVRMNVQLNLFKQTKY